MLSVYRRYFRVKTGPLMVAVTKAREINANAHKDYLKLLEEYGAEPQYYTASSTNKKLIAMCFESEPDRYLFKKVKRTSGWYPKKNNSHGKQIADRFEAIETRNESCLDVVDLDNFARITCNGRAYRSVMVVIPSDPVVLYISVPWYDVDPEELKAYKADTTNSYDHNILAVMWEPDEHMIEVKSWEMDKAITEWNESIKETNDE